MTLQSIKEQVMFQTNNDADDLGDFEPHLDDYVNEGYDLLVEAVSGEHIGGEAYPKLTLGTDIPQLPDWMHRALPDYAAWLVYRNGNLVKQNRGRAYLAAFDELLGKARIWAMKNAENTTDAYGRPVASGRFYNIYP